MSGAAALLIAAAAAEEEAEETQAALQAKAPGAISPIRGGSMNIIPSEEHWRVSKSGYSIKKGFMDNVTIVRRYEGPVSDMAQFYAWLEDAFNACDEHNAQIEARNA